MEKKKLSISFVHFYYLNYCSNSKVPVLDAARAVLCIGRRDSSCPRLRMIAVQDKRRCNGFPGRFLSTTSDNEAGAFVGGCHGFFYPIYRVVMAWKTQRSPKLLTVMTKSNLSFLLSGCSLGLKSSGVVIATSLCHQGNLSIHFGNPGTHSSSFAFWL